MKFNVQKVAFQFFKAAVVLSVCAAAVISQIEIVF